MAQPYVGEIRIFAGNFAPAGWMFCEGQLLPISENETLFQLIGTTYGGDGESTFALPDLRGRIPIHQGQGPGTSNRILAETGGVEEVTLTTQQIPVHNHAMPATETGQQLSPQGALFATPVSTQAGVNPYLVTAPAVSLTPNMILPTGGSQPHTNFGPYLCLNFIISLFGLFPQPT
jgi:microcystin-dependent protein